MRSGQRHSGICYYEGDHSPVTISDNSSITLTTSYNQAAVWLCFQFQSGYNCTFSAGHNGATGLNVNHGSFTTNDTDGNGCFISSGSSLTFKNRMGGQYTFSFMCYGMAQVNT